MRSPHPVRTLRPSRRRRRLLAVAALTALALGLVRAVPAQASPVPEWARYVTVAGTIRLDDYDDGRRCEEPIADGKVVDLKTVYFSFKQTCGTVTGEIYFSIAPDPLPSEYVQFNGWVKLTEKNKSGTVELGYQPGSASIPNSHIQQCGPVRLGDPYYGAGLFRWRVLVEPYAP